MFELYTQRTPESAECLNFNIFFLSYQTQAIYHLPQKSLRKERRRKKTFSQSYEICKAFNVLQNRYFFLVSPSGE